ncbi:ASCH domain-containing protein [Thermococcus sp. MV11]|uniref:ASCH domain-containing protein n=1 Tax=Thermococcus sp. MV11 TaxID=1638267 RepID=UPI001431C1B0|nr:ASCH domain-containing protein [Thermococcus sp. MV11]NJE03672.1 ASCH domain-containing protein [Thermococcus sp. MV11]
MEHVIALHQVYAELIFRGLKTVELRKSRAFQEGDTVFLYVARGNPYELRDTLRRLGLHPEQTITQRGTIAGGFEVGEVIRADLDTLWELTRDTSGLTLVHGENGKRWLGEYIRGEGYAFTIERPFLFKEPVSREEMKEKYGVHVEGIIHLSRRTRKEWVKDLIEDLLTREAVYI